MPHERVLGVDACKAGWVGIALAAGATRGYFAPRIDELADLAAADGSLGVIAIDMPIGLPDHGRRQADVLARAAIGPRRSSVFMTPVRSALEAASHAEAVAINRKLAGEGISIQAYGLWTKLLEVDSLGHRDQPPRHRGASGGLVRAHCRLAIARSQVHLGRRAAADAATGEGEHQRR
jgi:predicted RNase H-like nuclease